MQTLGKPSSQIKYPSIINIVFTEMLSRGLRTSSILRRTVNQSGLKAVVFSQLPRTLSANSSYNKQLMHFSTEKVVEEPPKTDAKKDSAVVVQYDYDDYDDYEEPKNAAGWVSSELFIS